jgi:hypothetical protein
MTNIDMADGVITLRIDDKMFKAALDDIEGEYESWSKGLKPVKPRVITSDIDRAIKTIDARLVNTSRRFRDVLADGAKRLETVANRMIKPSALAFAAGAGATALGASASPLASNTLSQSLENARAKIGSDFIPLIAEVSARIQQAGNAWRSMNEETRKNISNTVRMVAIAGAAGLAFAGIAKYLALIARSPLALAAGGAALLVMNQLDQSATNRDKFTNVGLASKDSVMSDERSEQLKKMNPGKARNTAQADYQGALLDYQLKKIDFDANEGGFRDTMENVGKWATTWGGKTYGPQKETAQEKRARELALAKQTLNEAKIRADELGGTTDPLPDMPEKAKRGSLGPASFAGVADLNKKIQLAAGGGSPLENETNKILTDMNKKFAKALEKFGIK